MAIPDLPHPEKPDSSEWVKAIAEAIGEPDRNTYIITHSLGSIALLQYLNSLETGSIGGAVLVAGFLEKLPTLPELDDFIAKPLDAERVKAAAGKLVAINSDDDPVVPLKNADMLNEKMGAEIAIIHGAGHVHEEFGVTELPIVLDKLHAMMNSTQA